MKIEVLGPGCPKCNALMANAKAAAGKLKLNCEIEKVTKITEITKYGIMVTPALVVDGEVKLAGKVPPVEELERLFAGLG